LRSYKRLYGVMLFVGIWSAQAAGQDLRPLTGDEITKAIVGNTVRSPNFAEYYAPDGSIHGAEGEKRYQGSWHIDGDRLCVEFPRHDFKDCAWVAASQSGEYSFMDGTRTDVRTVEAGNPDGL